MICDVCGDYTKVVYTIAGVNVRLRKRKCPTCGKMTDTIEKTIDRGQYLEQMDRIKRGKE